MSSTDSRQHIDAANTGDTQRELLSKVARNIELGLRVAAPATVVTYNATTQRADLLLGFLPVMIGPTGADVPAAPVSLPQVPVAWPRTNLGYLTFPIVPGDTGLVVFNDRNLTEWLRLGGATDPALSRCHDLADGVFLPGLHTDTAPIAPPTSAAATVLEGPLVHLGVAATQPAVLGTALAAAFTTFSATINTAMATWVAASAATDAWNGALATAFATALTNLNASITAALSAKVLVQ